MSKVKVKYIKDEAGIEKGFEKSLPISLAKELETLKVVKILKTTTTEKKVN